MVLSRDSPLCVSFTANYRYVSLIWLRYAAATLKRKFRYNGAVNPVNFSMHHNSVGNSKYNLHLSAKRTTQFWSNTKGDLFPHVVPLNPCYPTQRRWMSKVHSFYTDRCLGSRQRYWRSFRSTGDGCSTEMYPTKTLHRLNIFWLYKVASSGCLAVFVPFEVIAREVCQNRFQTVGFFRITIKRGFFTYSQKNLKTTDVPSFFDDFLSVRNFSKKYSLLKEFRGFADVDWPRGRSGRFDYRQFLETDEYSFRMKEAENLVKVVWIKFLNSVS